jgi:hypothetical protein
MNGYYCIIEVTLSDHTGTHVMETTGLCLQQSLTVCAVYRTDTVDLLALQRNDGPKGNTQHKACSYPMYSVPASHASGSYGHYTYGCARIQAGYSQEIYIHKHPSAQYS